MKIIEHHTYVIELPPGKDGVIRDLTIHTEHMAPSYKITEAEARAMQAGIDILLSGLSGAKCAR